MDPGGPQQNVTESRGDPSPPGLRERSGKVAKGAHAEKRERKYPGRRAGAFGRTKKYGGMKRPFGRPFITLEKGKDLM